RDQPERDGKQRPGQPSDDGARGTQAQCVIYAVSDDHSTLILAWPAGGPSSCCWPWKRADFRQSPRNLPICRKPFTLSQTAFNPAVNGMASSRPGASQRKPQSMSENVTTSGLRWTREPTIFG